MAAFDITKARKLKNSGKSYKHISELFGVNQNTLVSRMMKGAIGDTTSKRCADCGAEGVRLCRHHVCYQQNRIVLLCDSCHSKAHSSDPPAAKKRSVPSDCLPYLVRSATRMAQCIYCWRVERDLSIRQAASLIGVHYSVLLRFENGEEISGPNMASIFTWMVSSIDT